MIKKQSLAMSAILAAMLGGGSLWWWKVIRKPTPPPIVRVYNQIDDSLEAKAIADKYNIPTSFLAGWGLVGKINIGLCDGDGYWDGTPDDRDRAMIISRADSDETRWEYSIRGMMEKFSKLGLNPQTYDGLIVPDIESYNMRLFSGVVPNLPSGVTYTNDEYIFSKIFLLPKMNNDADKLQEYLDAHPHSIDANGDGINDSMHITYDIAIQDHIRITNKLRKHFPKAKFAWYAFPSNTYWGDDEEFARHTAGWERAIADLLPALDIFTPSYYDHYSHVFCFPHQSESDCTDQKFKKIYEREHEKWTRKMKWELGLAKQHKRDLVPYTWHFFHHDGRCDKSGWLISDEEWTDHIVRNLGFKHDGEQIDGIILWGAPRYYWDRNECYRGNMETYIGSTDEEFEAWLEKSLHHWFKRAKNAADQIWPPTSLR